MFEQTFKNIDDILHKDAGCTSELDYTEQSRQALTEAPPLFNCVHICQNAMSGRSCAEGHAMKVPAPETPSVGIREFRAALAEYIDADTPVTVTRHGQTVGLFVPLRRPSAEDVQRMEAAVVNFRKVVPLSDDDVEEMVAEFDALRRGRPLPSRNPK